VYLSVIWQCKIDQILQVDAEKILLIELLYRTANYLPKEFLKQLALAFYFIISLLPFG